MTRRALAAAVVAAVVAAVIGLAAAGLAVRKRPPVPTMTVSEDPFRVRVTAAGNLSAVTSTPLTAPLKPQRPFTLAWLVDDGTLVEKGDVIARFDPSQLERDRENGLTDRRISDHRIASAEVGREVNIDTLERQARIASQELDLAREFQSTDSLIYSRMEIAESRIDTELAEIRERLARQSQATEDDLRQAEIELLAIEKRKAEITLQQANDGLAALELTAPHSGLVILHRDWRGNPVRVGDTVWPGRPIGNIPDLGEMQAEVFVLEADAGDLEVGQKATVWLEADLDRGYDAAVASIDPMAGRRNRRVPVQYFRTVLSLERTETEVMKPGARVRGEIAIADLDLAVTVPRQAIASNGGASVVHRWGRDRFTEVTVELGPAALGRVVVLSGLSEGDVIALRNPNTSNDAGRENGGVAAAKPALGGGPR